MTPHVLPCDAARVAMRHGTCDTAPTQHPGLVRRSAALCQGTATLRRRDAALRHCAIPPPLIQHGPPARACRHRLVGAWGRGPENQAPPSDSDSPTARCRDHLPPRSSPQCVCVLLYAPPLRAISTARFSSRRPAPGRGPPARLCARSSTGAAPGWRSIQLTESSHRRPAGTAPARGSPAAPPSRKRWHGASLLGLESLGLLLLGRLAFPRRVPRLRARICFPPHASKRTSAAGLSARAGI
jgi:hypothetical protein